VTRHDDEAIDVAAVAADDELVESLRRSLSPDAAVVWDDDDEAGDDLSYALLRALQHDVSAEVELPPLVPVAPVVPLAGRRRVLGRTATVTAITAGVLSLAGAAAAAASSPGDAMYGVRSAVASAVHDAIDAMTPAAPIGPATAGPAVATPTATITPRGVAVSTAARSESAARQIVERLDTAQRLLDNGRAVPASQVLDQAERRLPLVTDATLRGTLNDRLTALRARAATLQAAPSAKPSRPAEQANNSKSNDHKPAARPERTADSRRGPAKSAEPTSTGRSDTAKVPAPKRSVGRDLHQPELPMSGAGARDRVDR
jgi:hypothetical protein